MNKNLDKALIRQTFDTVAPGYDRPALCFFHDSAAHLVEQLQLADHFRIGRQRNDQHIAAAGFLDAGGGDAEFDAGNGTQTGGIGSGEIDGHGRLCK